MWRVVVDSCASADLLVPSLQVAAVDASLTLAADAGFQVANQSLNRRAITSPLHCSQNYNNSECVAMAYASAMDVLMVGAVGNDRSAIQFPASDPRVVAVAGTGADLKLWDLSPQGNAGCPQPPPGQHVGANCGSNFTINVGTDRSQEVLAPAEGVSSTFYRGMKWNASCSDALDGTGGDGRGVCTGTSMSAPIVSGIAGILRSINPLLAVGDVDNQLSKRGVRSLLRTSTFESALGKAWEKKLGFGRVDAAAAARAMLGIVAGAPARNRATPLFSLVSAAARDHAAVATPPMALSIGQRQQEAWSPRGAAINGYPNYPFADLPQDFMPLASAFVLSTERRTRNRQPALAPLFLLDRARPWPLGCTPGAPPCTGGHIDYVLVSRTADLEQAHADGYRLLGRQGYVFQRCAPEPSCMPAGSVRLYQQCKLADDDCAVFVESEKAAFEADGYTASYPAGSDTVMGYAFPNIDTDQDQLIDGFERLIGTSPSTADSDGDGVADGVEYPLAGVPVSDPCGGATNACDPPSFFDGFE